MNALHRKLLICLAGLLALQAVILFAKYWSDLGPSGRFGGDFISFWRAAHHVADGRLTAIYDAAAWREVLSTPGRKELSWFVYPPFALIGLRPLGSLDYGPAVAIWSLVPIPFYIWGLACLMRRSLSRMAPGDHAPASHRLLFAVICAACLPLLSANLFTGQTGAILAVMLMIAVLCWWKRPVLSGIAIGLLTIKPQMGLLLPVALLASGQWRAIATAIATVAALVAVATGWLGTGIWFEYTAMTGLFAELMGQGYAGIRQLAVGPYISMLAVGTPVALAASLQIAVLLTLLIVIFQSFRASCGSDDPRNDLRLGLLAAGTLLATPYALAYDMPLLAIAIVPLVVRFWREGCELWELVALAALLSAPYVQPQAVAVRIPYAFLATALWFAVIYLRYAKARSSSSDPVRPDWA